MLFALPGCASFADTISGGEAAGQVSPTSSADSDAGPEALPDDTSADDQPVGSAILISSRDGGLGAEGLSTRPQINDSNMVVFESDSQYLPGSNGFKQIYRWWKEDGITLITNVGTAAAPVGASGNAGTPLINNDNSIVFASYSPDLPGGNEIDPDGAVIYQVYVWTPKGNLWAGEGDITLVSNAGSVTDPVVGDGHSGAYGISDNGAVVFESVATNLVAGWATFEADDWPAQVYLWTPADGVTLVSNAGSPEDPVFANGEARSPQINADGSVVFASNATNLPGGNGNQQVYLWTPADGLTLVSNVGTPESPVGANGDSSEPQINNEGSVAFLANAEDLPGGNGYAQGYLWTPSNGARLVSNIGLGTPVGANGNLGSPRISDDGSVVFTSVALGLPGGNGYSQIYNWTLDEGITLLTNAGSAAEPVGGNGNSSYPRVDANGCVAFVTDAADLPGGEPGTQIYYWSVWEGLAPVHSISPSIGAINPIDVWAPQLSDHGTRVVFTDYSHDVPAGNGFAEVYIWIQAKR
jgi:hypothetical protein